MEPISLGMKQIQEQLEKLTNWEIEEGKLEKTFNFPDFKQAKEFADKVSILAEEQRHHPVIEFSWGRVKIMIYTREIEALSLDDFILAQKIDRI